jgi:hypothetical protein
LSTFCKNQDVLLGATAKADRFADENFIRHGHAAPGCLQGVEACTESVLLDEGVAASAADQTMSPKVKASKLLTPQEGGCPPVKEMPADRIRAVLEEWSGSDYGFGFATH